MRNEVRASVAAYMSPRMEGRPVDHRGYPVPWFVTLHDDDGNWEFRVLDPRRYAEAIRREVCWICGKPLGKKLAFAVGPMCGINRISAEPPQHFECAEFAVKTCPFMLLPKAVRREAALPEARSSELHILRNPGVMLIWETHSMRVIRPNEWQTLFRMGEPERISFWREGRAATRAEIDESVASGCPALRDMAQKEGALDHYHELVEKFERLLPAA